MRPCTGDTVVVVDSPWRGYSGVVIGRQKDTIDVQIEEYTVTMYEREIEILRRQRCESS